MIVVTDDGTGGGGVVPCDLVLRDGDPVDDEAVLAVHGGGGALPAGARVPHRPGHRLRVPGALQMASVMASVMATIMVT